MAGDRDWSREMAKIDKQLESVSDEALFPTKTAGSPAQAAAAKEQQRTTSTLPALARLGLSAVLGVAILFWPYDARCGAGLAAYLAAVGVVFVGGVWSAVWTWRHRTAKAHVLALLLALWGLALASVEVLPRTGYARPDVLTRATWGCK